MTPLTLVMALFYTKLSVSVSQLIYLYNVSIHRYSHVHGFGDCEIAMVLNHPSICIHHVYTRNDFRRASHNVFTKLICDIWRGL